MFSNCYELKNTSLFGKEKKENSSLHRICSDEFREIICPRILIYSRYRLLSPRIINPAAYWAQNRLVPNISHLSSTEHRRLISPPGNHFSNRKIHRPSYRVKGVWIKKETSEAGKLSTLGLFWQIAFFRWTPILAVHFARAGSRRIEMSRLFHERICLGATKSSSCSCKKWKCLHLLSDCFISIFYLLRLINPPVMKPKWSWSRVGFLGGAYCIWIRISYYSKHSLYFSPALASPAGLNNWFWLPSDFCLPVFRLEPWNLFRDSHPSYASGDGSTSHVPVLIATRPRSVLHAPGC